MGAKAVVLVLAGGLDNIETPAVWFPWAALEQAGFEMRHVRYPDFRPKEFTLESAREFDSVVTERVKEALADGPWDHVAFVAKSRGTLVLGPMPGDVVRCDDVRVVWSTPLFGFDYVREGAIEKGWRSLVLSGSADPYYDEAGDRAVVEATGGAQVLIEGANHGLYVEGDIVATADGFRRISEACLEFGLLR